MGLFDTLFGTSSKATSTTTGTTKDTSTGTQSVTGKTAQTQTGSTTGSTTQTGNTATTQNQSGSTTQASTGSTQQSNTGTQTGSQTGSTTTQNLDPTTVAALQHLLGQLPTSSTDAATLRQIAANLQSNQIDPTKLIAGQTAAATEDYTENVAPGVARLAQTLGSSGGTYATQIAAQARSGLEAKLAGITADTTLQASQANNAALTQAASILSQAGQLDANQINQILGVVNSLKGANATTTSTGTSSLSTQDLINAITSGQTTGTTTGTTTGSETSSATQNTAGTSTANVTGTNQSDTTTTASQIADVLQKTSGNQKSTPGIIPSLLSLF